MPKHILKLSKFLDLFMTTHPRHNRRPTPRPMHYQQDQTPPGWSGCLASGTETDRGSPKQGLISPSCSFVEMQDGTITTCTEQKSKRHLFILAKSGQMLPVAQCWLDVYGRNISHSYVSFGHLNKSLMTILNHRFTLTNLSVHLQKLHIYKVSCKLTDICIFSMCYGATTGKCQL